MSELSNPLSNRAGQRPDQGKPDPESAKRVSRTTAQSGRKTRNSCSKKQYRRLKGCAETLTFSAGTGFRLVRSCTLPVPVLDVSIWRVLLFPTNFRYTREVASHRRSAYLGEDGTPYRGGSLLSNLLLFGRICRALGMGISLSQMIEVARSLEWVRLAAKPDFYHALRALMVSRAADLALFDEAFRLFWRQPSRGWTQMDLRSLGEKTHRRRTRFLPSDEPRDQPEPGRENETPLLLSTYSAREVLRHKDFAAMNQAELSAARDWISQLRPMLGRRRTRRLVAGPGKSPWLTRLLRETLKHSGEVVEIPRAIRKWKPRPLVLICDVSGSMERYTRVLLHFAHALAGELGQVESFVFGTRLTRITRALRVRSVDQALQRISSQVKDWSGGTLTGAALHRFNFGWSRRVLGRGAVVLLVTDGWDRGDPEELAWEMERLHRACRRLIWLNPLQGGPRYEPLTRGAQAILPFCDRHLSVRNLSSLEELARYLAEAGKATGGGRKLPTFVPARPSQETGRLK